MSKHLPDCSHDPEELKWLSDCGEPHDGHCICDRLHAQAARIDDAREELRNIGSERSKALMDAPFWRDFGSDASPTMSEWLSFQLGMEYAREIASGERE